MTARHYIAIVAAMILCCLECSAEANAAERALSVLCPKRMRLAPLFEEAAARNGLQPSVLVAQARNESGCNPRAVGPGGEIGVMQLRPGTIAAAGLPPHKLFDAKTNIELGAAHLSRCLSLCGDLAGALGVYAGHKTCKAGRRSGYAKRVLTLARLVNM